MKKRHSKEFKEQAVKLAETRPQVEVAKNLGINANMLSKWSREARTNPINAFSGKGTPEQERL